jgi:glycosyltransferase involved in cell wall biosynthesis
MTGNRNGSLAKFSATDRLSQGPHELRLKQEDCAVNEPRATVEIALLTGGGDKPYALGMAAALTSEGILLDFIGSDDLQVPELLNNARINFLNLRGDQCPNVSPFAKVRRILSYYIRLVCYAATARPKIFHILWTNKFVFFDRTLLLAYYRLLGKRIVLTAHNVNAGKRDSNDSWLNRFSLKCEYSLSDHIFVHTEKMKNELSAEFDISPAKVSVIPFGINNTTPNTNLSTEEAKRRLGLVNEDKAILFFGNIAPYKGLEYLVSAFGDLLQTDSSYRLIIVGKPKGDENYWSRILRAISRNGIADRVIERIEYIPDEETELYFKAADVLVLPYTHVFQSGVLFLGYSYGLPAIAADVGSLGETGLIFKAQDSLAIARALEQYFASELFRQLESGRSKIKAYANERYSWSKVATITIAIYSALLGKRPAGVMASYSAVE